MWRAVNGDREQRIGRNSNWQCDALPSYHLEIGQQQSNLARCWPAAIVGWVHPDCSRVRQNVGLNTPRSGERGYESAQSS